MFVDSLPWLGSLEAVMSRAQKLLAEGGTIHIINTNTEFPMAKRLEKTRAAFEEYCEDKRMTDILPHYEIISRQDIDIAGFSDMNVSNALTQVFKRKTGFGWFMRKIDSC